MLPPLLLRVKPGMRVLDMCAAPGSKTCLLLSALAGSGTATLDSPAADVEGGCVVANEINPLRCNRLRVRMGRTRVAGQLLVCHPAQSMPGAAGSFDRVLADVPCSGDGTLRKNPDIWSSWQPRFSASLHPLQLQILKRGLDLLAPGGLLVYSTCSFSPTENEAVVAEAIRSAVGGMHAGHISLVEIHDALPELRTARGLNEWRVTAAADGSSIASYAEASATVVEEWRLTPSLFSPNAEEAAQLFGREHRP